MTLVLMVALMLMMNEIPLAVDGILLVAGRALYIM
jgi:hypothetical protein